MASVTALRDGLKVRLVTITGLRTHDTIPDSINVPAAIVGFPEIEFDKAFGRGSDRFTFPVRVYASKASDRAGQDKIDGYLAGSGSGSIKAAIEGDITLAGIASFAVVTKAGGYGVYQIGGIDYLGVEFSVDVMTSGT